MSTLPSQSPRCLSCGYDLSGLPETGLCPECSAPIERSLRGNLLRYASPAYVNTLRTGATLVFVATLVNAFGWVPRFAIGALLLLIGIGVDRLLESALNFVTLAGMLGGWWMLSTPDPAFVGEDDSRDWRFRLRLLLPFASIVILAHVVLPLSFSPFLSQKVPLGAGTSTFTASYDEVIAWSARILHACVIYAGLKYIRALSLRLPNLEVRKLSNDTSAMIGIVIVLCLLIVAFGVAGRFASWLYIVIGTLFISVIVVFLIWLVNYLVLFAKLRKSLTRAAKLAQLDAAHYDAAAADSIQPPPITQSGSELS